MNSVLKTALAVAAVAISAHAAAGVTLYEREGFQGQSFSPQQQERDLGRVGFNDRASSAVVTGERWEVCEDSRFGGRCVVLRPGRYSSLGAMGLNDRVSSVRVLSASARIDENRYAPSPVADRGNRPAPQITFYEREGFEGRSFTTDKSVGDLGRDAFNDRASSVVVIGGRWEACENAGFGGRCAILRQGRYSSLTAMGLNDRISSVRTVSRTARVDENRIAPDPVPVYDNRRQEGERLYQANVTSVHAVVGTPEQRCWVEKQPVAQPQQQSQYNIPGAVVGAVIGGILGHQVGNGRGNDVATVGGAVAGGAIGANVGRPGAQPAQTQDVQRCENVSSQARPDYWDVTYNFRGQEHRIQMTTQPGATVTVNEQGEPRA